MQERLMAGKKNLSPHQKSIFDLLFLKGIPEVQVASQLGLDAQSFESERSSMLRALRGRPTQTQGVPA